MLSFALHVEKNTLVKLELVKLSDHVQVYEQHVRQPEYQKFKVEEQGNLRKGTCKIFP